ncbi:MAG: heliorhodopsin HeR [Nitriliruptoraceae bacterium]
MGTNQAVAGVRHLVRLWRFNLTVGLLHLAQAGVMLALSNDLAFPITASLLTGDPVAASGPPPAEVVFELPIGPTVAFFLLLAAADHLLMTLPGVRGWYERNLRREYNLARWMEYSLSASVMLILIAALAGIWNLAALIGLFAANSAMILFGWLQETDHQPGGSMTPFWFGTLIGLIPWLAIGYHLIAGEDPPGFVYAIFVSLFVLFSSFGLNQWLQYRQVGRWRDYLYGEQVYILLSLVAKSLLAWQIFANVLRA